MTNKKLFNTISAAFVSATLFSCQIVEEKHNMKEAETNPAFICPITNEIFRDPVIATDGHTYERSAIVDWLKKKSISPLSRMELKVEDLRPNLVIESMIKEFYNYEEKSQRLKNENANFLNRFSSQLGEIKNLFFKKETEPQNIKDKKEDSVSTESFICPLTKKIFEEPVMATDGYTYEKKAIETWLAKDNKSPKTNLPIDVKDLRPNHAIKSMIDLFKTEEKQLQNLKETERKCLNVFYPKVREILNRDMINLEKDAAEKLESNWGEKIDITKNKRELMVKQMDLDAYKLKEDKSKFQVPNALPNFTGREEELTNVEKALKEKRIVCIVGHGGVGKSQLVTEYVNKTHYSSVVWLHGEHDFILSQMQTYLQTAYGIPVAKMLKNDELVEQFYQLLAKDSCLVVIDNAENEDAIREFLPKQSAPDIIITSRYKSWNMPTIDLGSFSPKEIFLYVEKSIEGNLKISEKAVIELHQLVDGLPLAISQAIAYVNQKNDFGIADYCNLFRKNQEETLKNGDGEVASIYTTLTLALYEVKNKHTLVDSIMNMIAYLSPDHIDRDLVLEFLNKDSNTKTKISKKKIKDAFRVLEKYSILFRTEKDGAVFGIHRLNQLVMRIIHKKMNAFDKNFNQAAEWLFPQLYYDEADLKDIHRVSQLVPHGLSIAGIEDTDSYLNKDLLWRQLGFHQFYALRNALQAKICLENALNISETRHRGDKDTNIRILNDLGNVYGYMGNAEKKLELLKKALNLSEKHFGKNHIRTSETLTNLGDAYGDLGEYEKQKNSLLRSLDIKENHLKLGKDHPSISTTLVNLATAYGNLGDYKKKKELLTRALYIDEKHFGKDHPKTATTRMNLGNANRSLGAYEDSIESLLNDFQSTEKKFGKDHPDTALAAMNLGISYNATGDHKKALDLITRALDIHEKYFGPNHPITGRTLINLSKVYYELDNEKKSKHLSEAAYKIFFDYYGPNHPETQMALSNLESPDSTKTAVDMCRDFMESMGQEKMQKANSDEKFLEKEFLSYSEKFAEKHENNHETKAAMLKFALSQSKKHPNNPYSSEEWKLLSNLGQQYFQLGKYKEAVTKHTEALAMNEKILGKDHVTAGTILTDLGSAYNMLDQFERALEFLKRALLIQEKHLGEKDSLTAITLTNLGCAYDGLKNHLKNKEVTERAYKIFLKCHGPKHQNTEDALFNLQLVEKKLSKQKPEIKKDQTILDNGLTSEQTFVILVQKYGIDLMQKYGFEVVLELDMLVFSVEDDIEMHGKNHPETLKSKSELDQFLIIYGIELKKKWL